MCSSHWVGIVNGSSGNDTLFGNDGADLLDGGSGNDWLYGGDGDSVLSGGGGADILSGGDGHDIASYGDAKSALFIDLAQDSSTWTGDAQGDVLTSIEELYLTDFTDFFRGDANDNIVFGGDGNDRIEGRAGNDHSGAAIATTACSATANDWMEGGDGNDILVGGRGGRYPFRQ